MTPIQRAIILSLISGTFATIPGFAPELPVAAKLMHVSPAVRRIVGGLHQIDLPMAWRRKNWTGDRGQGSCVHAALVHLWHWQGRHELAEWWRAHHGNGETADGLATKLELAGLQFAETRAGDERFLEWAIRTRRGAAVVVQDGAHMVNLVGLDQEMAQILDSNRPQQIQRWPRDEFFSIWRRSGGWAIVPLAGPPLPPDPWIVRTFSSHPNPH